MSAPLVSVVMAVRNVDRYLAEAIESILGQTFTDFEFVIVDFGSTDDSKSIVSRYAANDNRIKFHEIPVCMLPVARNAGCSLARGEYIAVMDADDVCLSDRLKLEVEFMQKHRDIALLGGAVEWIDATGKPLGAHHHPTGFPEITLELTTHCTFWHPSVLMRKEAFVSDTAEHLSMPMTTT
jgi:glycosyltransferase involved in cell wall biosynthesis